MKYKNTLQKGSVRFIIFKEDATWYGVCLEFNIVEEGSTPQEAYMLLNEAAQGYVESARKIKARPHILNQVSDCEYESLWSKLQGAEDQKEKMPSVFSFGKINLNQLRNNAFAPVWLWAKAYLIGQPKKLCVFSKTAASLLIIRAAVICIMLGMRTVRSDRWAFRFMARERLSREPWKALFSSPA